MSQYPSLSQRILDCHEQLPRGERRLADLLLAQPAALLHHSATELAEQAGISKATAARFFRSVGYPSFRAAKRDAAVLSQTGDADRLRDGHATQLSTHLEAEVQNLLKTVEHQRSDLIARVLRSLAHAEKLWVVGFGQDYPLAHFARALLIRVRPDIRMLPIGGFSVPEEFASISKADTMLAFGVGKRTRALRNVMLSAQAAGAKLVFITDLTGSVDGDALVLRCRTRGVGPFDSVTSAVSLMTYLCAALANRIGEAAVDRQRLIDEIHAEWGDLLNPSP